MALRPRLRIPYLQHIILLLHRYSLRVSEQGIKDGFYLLLLHICYLIVWSQNSIDSPYCYESSRCFRPHTLRKCIETHSCKHIRQDWRRFDFHFWMYYSLQHLLNRSKVAAHSVLFPR